MGADPEKSLSDEATFAGAARRRPASEVSIGDERTLGDNRSGQDTAIDDIEVVDLEARYRVEGTLGQGGMGAVLLATDTRLDRKVAIKRILGEAAGNRMAVQRFLTEAKAIAALNHPNIVQIYDYGRAKDGPFLIMELVDGGSLLDRCRESALPLDEAINLACHLCDGLAKAHDLGIIHRDIKPANVLLTKDGIPKLTDFGLAKAQASDHGQTMTGAVLGTPDFMPTEQRKDASLVDHRSDLWSLAATVYQMATGRSPKIIRFDLLPAELTKVLGKALEDAKDERFQTAREFRDALKASLRAASPVTIPVAAEVGQCPACGVSNDISRRFCRGCGSSLETPCLSCAKPMPIWENVCGACGVGQAEAAPIRLGEASVEEAKAEAFLTDLEFSKAEEIARRLGAEQHPVLASLRKWSSEFLPRIAESRTRSLSQAAEDLASALQAEAESDYLSAIFTLEMVPPPLHDMRLPNVAETIATAMARLKSKQAESLRLNGVLRDRLSAKDFDDLAPVVERLIVLHPQRPDLGRLRIQLSERRAKQTKAREEALAKARDKFATHDYDGAAHLLTGIARAVESAETTDLLRRAKENARRTRDLAEQIRSSMAAKQYEGLLPKVKDYLLLKPNDTEINRIVRVLQDRETKLAAEVIEITKLAEQLRRQSAFAKAAETWLRIPEPRRTSATIQSIAGCRALADARAAMLRASEQGTKDGADTILEMAYDYRRQLDALAIRDHEIEALVATIQNARQHARMIQAWWRLGQVTIAAVVLFASVVGGIAGLWRFSAWSSGTWRPGEIVNGIGMRLVPIDAGELRSREKLRTRDGAEYYHYGTRPMKTPFIIGSTEVTQEEWCNVMSTRPWDGQPEAIAAPRQPATYVTRADAQEFCRALTQRERARSAIDAQSEYRLPTWWEWEYASCAGAMTRYHFGDKSEDLPKYEWCAGSPGGKERDHPYEVGLKRPNRWGIYDAFGNVLEICSDGVLGACWKDPPDASAMKRGASSRGGDGPGSHIGFRVVLGTVEK